MPVCTYACTKGWLSLESTTVLMNLLVAGQLFKRNRHKIFPYRAIVLWFIACITCDLSGSMFVFIWIWKLSHRLCWPWGIMGCQKRWRIMKWDFMSLSCAALRRKLETAGEENWKGWVAMFWVGWISRWLTVNCMGTMGEREYQPFNTRKGAVWLESTAMKIKSRFLTKLTKNEPTTHY